MYGVNLSDMAQLAEAVEPLRPLLGTWTAEDKWARLQDVPAGSPLLGIFRYVAALRHLDAGRALEGSSQSEIQNLLAAASAGHVLNAASRMPGFEARYKTLKELAAAGQFERFLDTLFEAESAVHFVEQMGSCAAGFEAGAHPDLWAWFEQDECATAYPCECKRIEPIDRVQEQQEALAAALEVAIDEAGVAPSVILVDLHEKAARVDAEELVTVIRHIEPRLDTSGSSWITASAPDGKFQITMRYLGELAEMKRRPALLPDIKPSGSMRVRTETIFEGSDQDPVAMRSVIRLRSDRLPDRIGAFERNLTKAVEQLRRLASAHSCGFITVRLRPPRGLGDLYEADQIVRRVLAERTAWHVGLVVLLWNEGEEVREQLHAEAVHRTAVYRFQAHYISNPLAPKDFSGLDSYAARFPPIPYPMLRDPGSGELVPLDITFMGDPSAEINVPDDEGHASLYFEFRDPYDGTFTGPLPSYLRWRGRKIAVAFIDDASIRCFEMVDGHFTHTATIDLRAWISRTRFLLMLEILNEGFLLKMPSPEEQEFIAAKSAKVRGVYT